MKELLFVAVGGAIGAMLRYSIGLLPIRSDFPYLTLCINILGAFIIGMIVGCTSFHVMSDSTLLLLKTGFCGGFTTFSTFSLEALTLLQTKHYGSAFTYMLASLLLCLLAVFLGTSVMQHFFQK